MPDFRDDDRIDLGPDITVRAVNVSGRASVGQAPDGPVRELEPQPFTAESEAAEHLAKAVAGAGMRVRTSVDFPTLEGTGQARLELEVDAPAGDDEAQVVLEVDQDTGLFRWHWPQVTGLETAGTRQRYQIPVEPPVAAPAGVVHEGVIGFLVRKALHVIRFPVEKAAGWTANALVTTWENAKRPYGLHTLNPDGGRAHDVDAAWLARQDGTFLLLVHGTFSTGKGAFDKLCGDTGFRRLHELYEGRVLVFDHPTLHVAPSDNARWLCERLPTDRQVTFDLLAHSRGGLVARELGLRSEAKVNRMLQVASPNAGTALCSTKRIGQLLDVTTNLASLLPDSPFSTTLEGVLEVVKQVGIGAFKGLKGLTAMDPDGDQLKELNSAPAPGFPAHAIAADYEPGASASLAERALDLTVDQLFRADNDMVVPTASMSAGGGFVVKNPFRATVGLGERSVAHTSYFGAACVRTEIARCLALPPGMPG